MVSEVVLDDNQPIGEMEFRKVESDLMELFVELDNGFGLKVSEVARCLPYGNRKIGRVLTNSSYFMRVCSVARRYRLDGVDK